MEEELIKEQKVLAEKAEELYKEGKRLLAEKDFDKAFKLRNQIYSKYAYIYIKDIFSTKLLVFIKVVTKVNIFFEKLYGNKEIRCKIRTSLKSLLLRQ